MRRSIFSRIRPRFDSCIRLFRGRRLKSSARLRSPASRDQRLVSLAPTPEHLETRLALAVDLVFETPNAGTGEVWSTFLTAPGDSVYLKTVSMPTETVFVADNASFNDRIETRLNTNDNTYFYDGELVTRTQDFDPPYDATDPTLSFGLPVGYPWADADVGRRDLQFVIPVNSTGLIWSDPAAPISGSLELNDGSANDTIVFDNRTGPGETPGPISSGLRILSGPGAGGILRVSSTSVNGNYSLVFDDDVLFNSSVGTRGVPRLSVRGNVDSIGSFPDIFSFNDIGAVTGRVPGAIFDLYDESMHQYVPGTLSGTIEVVFGPTTSEVLNFQVQETTPDEDGFVDISFWDHTGIFPRADRLATGSFGTFRFYTGDNGNSDQVNANIDAQLHVPTGTLIFEQQFDLPLSYVLSNTRMGIRDFDQTDNPADPLGLTFGRDPTSLTVYSSHPLTSGFVAEFAGSGSSINVEGPIVAPATGRVSFAATNINIDAPVRAPQGFSVPAPQNSQFGTVTERIDIQTVVSANTFEISVADDPNTTTHTRGILRVGRSGSLAQQDDVLSAPLTAPNRADSIFVEANSADVYIEGEIFADDQSYLIRSPQLSPDMTSQIGQFPDFEPYFFTTKSSLTGSDSGRIEGTNLAINLANDVIVLPDPESEDPFVPSTAYAVCDITIDVNSLRVQAADRGGDPLDQPFPYKLSIREEGDLVIDAVAASSGPIDIRAGGTIDLLGSMESAGDVRLEPSAELELRAPVTTRFGTIHLEAPSMVLNSAVRVVDAVKDEREVDIRLIANAGGIELNDAVSGINRVVVDASANGAVFGDGRIFGDVAEVFALDNVDILTQASRVAVRASGSVKVQEATNGVFEVRDARSVTLTAAGYDQIVRAGDAGVAELPARQALVSPALYADVYDTEVLTVSAANGSVDVLHYGDGTLAIGDAAAIGAGEEVPMSAAGSVKIRSTLADISVYDAPSAVANARTVRLATTGVLLGTDALNSPGVVPSRLSNVKVTRVNSSGESMAEAGFSGVDAGFRYARELDGVDVATLRLGDDVLIKGGTRAPNEQIAKQSTNGIYTIVGITYPVGDTSYVELDFVRRQDSDTTDDLSQKHYVQVTDGKTLAGTTWTADGTFRETIDGISVPVYQGWGPAAAGGELAYEFANVFDNVPQNVPVRVRPVVSRSGYLPVKATTTGPLLGGQYEAAYDHNGGIIEGASFSLPQFDGVDLGNGDLVLVRSGASDGTGLVDPRSAGVYKVTNIGNGVSVPWLLERYQGVDEDGDGLLDAFFTGLVAVSEGSLRTSVTGEMYEISLDSIGFSDLRYQEVKRRTFGSPEAVDDVLQYSVDIGSNDPLDSVTFIVSTENGENNQTGSFGRMLGLYQGNVATNDRTGVAQEQSLNFADYVSRIELRQELPPIYREGILISAGDLRVTVDGRYIEKSWEGKPLRSGSVIAAVGPLRQSDQLTGRRLTRQGLQGYGDEIYGLQFTPTADYARVSGLAVGGFNNGSAILLQGASNVLLSEMVVGQDGGGTVLANKRGIEIQGGGVDHTTIRGVTVVNSQEAGLLLGTSTQRVHVVGSTFGEAGQSNSVGISLQSDSVIPSYVGSAQSSFSQALNLAGSVASVNGDTAELVFAANATIAQVRPGMVLYDSPNRIVRNVIQVTYDTKGTDDFVDDSYTVTVDNANAVGESTGIGSLQEGGAVAGQLGHLVESVSSPGVVSQRDDKIYLPDSISERDVFIGQAVASVQGVFSPNTTIKEINTDPSSGRVTLTLSSRVSRTSEALLLLGESGGNSVVGNGDGIVLGSNSSSIVDTRVLDSIYDGIRVERTDSSGIGMHVIGDALGSVPGPNGIVRPTSQQNVVVVGSGLSGIRFSAQAFAALGAIAGDNTTPGTTIGVPADGDALADYQVLDAWLDHSMRIIGNYIGYDPLVDGRLGNGLTGVENVVVELDQSDSHYDDRGRLAFLLTDDSTSQSDNGTAGDLTDDPPFARMRPVVSTSLDSRFNQYAEGTGEEPIADDREVTAPRRPIVR